MTEKKNWNQRQLTGFENTKNCRENPEKISYSLTGKKFNIDLKGKIKDFSEIEKETDFIGTIYEVESLIIKKGQKKELDISKVKPDNWNIKALQISNSNFSSPEILEIPAKLFKLDIEKKEIIVGSFNRLGPASDERITKILLWDIIAAKFLEEVGQPRNESERSTLIKQVGLKRNKVLKAFGKHSASIPEEVMSQKFRL